MLASLLIHQGPGKNEQAHNVPLWARPAHSPTSLDFAKSPSSFPKCQAESSKQNHKKNFLNHRKIKIKSKYKGGVDMQVWWQKEGHQNEPEVAGCKLFKQWREHS